MMYKQCRTEQSASRQRFLENGLLEAMLTRHYDEISVSDLCTQLEIPRKSFYRYFSSKEGALHALLDHSLMEFEGFAGENLDICQEMENFFRYWHSRKPLLDALKRSNMSGVLIQRAIGHALSETVTPPSSFHDKTTQNYAVIFGVCGLMSLVVQWHHDGYPIGVPQMAAHAAQLLQQPIYPSLEGLF